MLQQLKHSSTHQSTSGIMKSVSRNRLSIGVVLSITSISATVFLGRCPSQVTQSVN